MPHRRLPRHRELRGVRTTDRSDAGMVRHSGLPRGQGDREDTRPHSIRRLIMTENNFIESFDRMHPNLKETMGENNYNLLKNWLHGAYSMGYTEAINHPINPWHKASEELPKVDKYRKCIKVFARKGDAVFVAFYSPVAGFNLTSSFYVEYALFDMEYWMEIPKIKED